MYLNSPPAIITGPGHPIIMEFVCIFPCIVMMLQGSGWVRVGVGVTWC